MFAANAELDFRTRCAATLSGNLHEFANTIHIKRNEWVLFDDAFLLIGGDERCGIIT